MLTARHSRRALSAALVAAVLLSLHVVSAAGTRLSVGERSFRAVWTPLRFTVESLSVNCNVTFEGSFHSGSIDKVERALVGYVNRASLATCTNGSATVLTETLPWHVQYGGFTGSLPNIASMRLRLIGASVRISFGERETTCLARTEAASPGALIAARNEASTLTSLRWDETVGIPLTGSFFCTVARGRFVGTSSTFGTPAGGTISLTLIGEEPPTLSPSPVEFGRVEVEAVVSRAVTIRAGIGAVEVRSITLRSGVSFAILDPNRCVGSRLPERGTCVFRAIFAAPRETGRSFEDGITVGTNAGTVEDTVRAST